MTFKRFVVFDNAVEFGLNDPEGVVRVSEFHLRGNVLKGRKLFLVEFRTEDYLRQVQADPHYVVLPSLHAPHDDWKEYLQAARSNDAAWYASLGLQVKAGASISTLMRKLREAGGADFSVETEV